jgi:4'-phosphopantetheinyl transferase EntD
MGISRILPASVIVSERYGPHSGELLDEEQSALGPVVPHRKLEFTAGRTCAREALGKMGIGRFPILRGLNRAPRWPSGVIGSITHCHNYCAAAVASQGSLLTLGIDAEPDEPLPEGVLAMISHPDEALQVEECRLATPANWDRVLFSAKESIYKAWFPVTGSWLAFGDARVHLHPEAGSFDVEILAQSPWNSSLKLIGTFLVDRGLVLTSVISYPDRIE